MDVLNYIQNTQLGSIRNRNRRFKSIPSCCNFTNKLDVNFLLQKLKCHPADDHLTIGVWHSDTDNDIDEEYPVPAFACKFSRTSGQEHILALSTEEGTVNILNTKLQGDATYMCSLPAHENAVFDVCWVPNEAQILTVSGDKTASIWDIQQEKKLASFKGHHGSIKWADFRPQDKSVFATAARDGCIIIWDSRTNKNHNYDYKPDNIIKNCHSVKCNVGRNKKKVSSPCLGSNEGSVTAAVFQDENTLISAGSSDGIIKVWDLRKHYSNLKNLPIPKFTIAHNKSNKYGYSSLVFDSRKLSLFANSCDNTIYQFDCASYSSTPVATYTGHQNRTFFIKSALSPDDQYLLSGSSDNFAYIWKISEPGEPVFKLEAHSDEVTAVAWSSESIPKIATCGDDMRFKLWRVWPDESEPRLCDKNIDHSVSIPRPKQTVFSPPTTTKSLRARRLFTDTCLPDTLFETPSSSPSVRNTTPTKRPKKRSHEQENAYRTKSTEKKSVSPKCVLSPSKLIRNEDNIRRKLAFGIEEIEVNRNNGESHRSSFSSPTSNLPNFVIDRLTPTTTPSSSKKKTRQGNWLTGHQEKLKATPKRTEPSHTKKKRRLSKSRKVDSSPNISSYFSSPVPIQPKRPRNV